ncbi:Ycf48-like protein precursor [compost metagenome]
MNNKNVLTLPAIVLGLFSVFVNVQVAWAQVAEDVLERPAMPSQRLAERVLLAITRAGERVVAVGEHGLVLLSDDQGESWRQAQVPVSVTLTNAYFVDAREGWVVGHAGVVLHSADGGESWQKQLDGRAAAELVLAAALALTPANPQQVVEARRLIADGPDKPLLDVHFRDRLHGLVVGAYGLAFTTDDGGRHWVPQMNIPNPRGKHLYRIAMTGQELFIAGEQGALFHSANSGSSFSVLPTPYDGSYFGLLTDAKGLLLLYGLRGNLFRSDNAGQSWQEINSGGSISFADGLHAQDGSLLLVDQAGRVLRSEDQGHSFQSLAIAQVGPVAGITETENGNLLLAGLHGITRIPSASLSMGVHQ